MPVENAAHKGGNQRHARFGTGHRLGETEQQREVAVNPLFLQLLSRADPLPGGGDLDQYSLVANAGIVV